MKKTTLRKIGKIEDLDDHEILVISLSRPEVFEVIVNRYQKPFLKKIISIVKNKEAATDIVQDTFVKIYINAKKFKLQEGASFKSWSYKILLNTCYSYCKKKKREKEMISLVEQDVLQSFGAEDDFERKLKLDHFLTIVAKLPESFASLLKRVMLDGKSHEDIAIEDNTTIGATRTRLHRARNEFKKMDAIYNARSLKTHAPSFG